MRVGKASCLVRTRHEAPLRVPGAADTVAAAADNTARTANTTEVSVAPAGLFPLLFLQLLLVLIPLILLL